MVEPVLQSYAPDLVIVAAGFDAADGDPLGGCKVGRLAVVVCQLSVGRRLCGPRSCVPEQAAGEWGCLGLSPCVCSVLWI